MNSSFGAVQRDAIDVDRATPVRVQCEAQDCRALLEVNVSPGQRLDRPVIVRCGSCKRLLEVNLAQAQMSALNQQRHQTTVLKAGASSTTTGAFRGTADGFGFLSSVVNKTPSFPQRPEARTLLDQEFAFSPPPTLRSHTLVQPPPLTRHPPSQHKAVMESLSSQLTGPLLWYPSTDPYGGGPLDPLYEQSGGMDSLGYGEFASGGITLPRPKTKKQKSTKPRNPSPYNMFMSQEVKHIKATNPTVDHKEAFKMAASNWAKSPNNCSNRRLPLPTEPTPPPPPVETEPPGEDSTKEKTTNTVKRRAEDSTSEDPAVNEEKRRKTKVEILEPSSYVHDL